MPLIHKFAGFDPLQFPCAFYVDSSQGVSLDGSAHVTPWADLSGNGRNMTNASSALALTASVFGNMPGVESGGATGLSNTSFGGATITSATLMLVAKWDTTDSVRFACGGFGSESGKLAISYQSNSLYFYSNGANNGHVADTTTTPQILSLVYNGAGDTNADKLKGYQNGAAKELTFGGTIPTSIAAITSYFLFQYDATQYRMDGKIGCLLMYIPALSDVQRNQVERWASFKYSIALA